MASDNVKLSKLLFEYVDNIDEFIKKLKTLNHKQAHKFIVKNCTYIASGMARQVFAINDDWIIKISETAQISKQTNEEIRLLKCTNNNNLVLPKALVFNEQDYNWIIFERALYDFENKPELFVRKMSEELNFDLFPLIKDVYDIRNGLEYMLTTDSEFETSEHIANNLPHKFIEELKTKPKSDWLNNFLNLSKFCKFDSSDLHLQNFGLMQDGRVTIIDFA